MEFSDTVKVSVLDLKDEFCFLLSYKVKHLLSTTTYRLPWVLKKGIIISDKIYNSKKAFSYSFAFF